MRKSGPPTEAEIIARAMRGFASKDQRVMTGIGDDAAVLRGAFGPHAKDAVAGERLVVTTDMLIEGVHFDLRFMTMADLGYKALMVNLSDVAAMGGRPAYAFAILGVPPSAATDDIDSLLEGVREAAAAGDTRLVGGDTTRAPQWLLGFTVIGELAGQPLLRSGARPGDHIWHSGSLGLSQVGLHRLWADEKATEHVAATAAHRRPQARLELGAFLRSNGLVTSCLDLSDSLSQCLIQLASASRIGLELDFGGYPFDPELRAFRRQLRAWPAGGPGAFRLPARYRPERKPARFHGLAEFVLASAEDYQLLFTAPPAAADMLSRAAPEPVTRLGTALPARRGRKYRDEHGQTHELLPIGFEHL
jgi:thiamine-monophosphate kinase